MDVIGNAADGQCLDPVFARDATKIRPETFADRRCEHRFAAFRRKDAMVEGTNEGVYSAVPDGTLANFILFSQR